VLFRAQACLAGRGAKLALRIAAACRSPGCASNVPADITRATLLRGYRDGLLGRPVPYAALGLR
jgi:hypothetical protein